MIGCVQHVWIPKRNKLFYFVFCGQCGEVRRIRLRWFHPEPGGAAAILGEAIDRGVIHNNEVSWGGQRLR